MGEFDVALDDIFANGQAVQEVWSDSAFLISLSDLDMLQPRWFTLKSSRKKATISGEIQLQLTLADSSNENATEEQILRKWQLWQANFIQTPSPSSTDCDPMTLGPAEEEGSDYEDEEESPSPDDESTMADKPPKKGKGKKFNRKKKAKGQPYELNQGSDVIGVIFLEISSITDLPPEKNSM
jgi:phosphatidylserine decarboxylase